MPQAPLRLQDLMRLVCRTTWWSRTTWAIDMGILSLSSRLQMYVPKRARSPQECVARSKELHVPADNPWGLQPCGHAAILLPEALRAPAGREMSSPATSRSPSRCVTRSPAAVAGGHARLTLSCPPPRQLYYGDQQNAIINNDLGANAYIDIEEARRGAPLSTHPLQLPACELTARSCRRRAVRTLWTTTLPRAPGSRRVAPAPLD